MTPEEKLDKMTGITFQELTTFEEGRRVLQDFFQKNYDVRDKIDNIIGEFKDIWISIK